MDSAPKIVHPLSKKRLMSIGQAASFLGVSIDTLRNWEKAGKIKSIRENGGIRRYSLTKLKKTQQSHPRLEKKSNEPTKKAQSPDNHIDLLNPSTFPSTNESSINTIIKKEWEIKRQPDILKPVVTNSLILYLSLQ